MDVGYYDHWAELNPDLLDEIVKHVDHGDYIRLRTVCKKWSLELPKIPKHIKNPWLFLPIDDENETIRPFFNLRDNKVYNLELPEMRKTIFRGSCYGCLITLTIDGALQILNPFTRAQYDLPPLLTFPDVKAHEPDRLGFEYTVVDIRDQDEYNVEKYLMRTSHVWKVIISAPPDHDNLDFMAMAIYGEFRRLACYRTGDTRWTDLPSTRIPCQYEDAIFHEGNICVVDCMAQLFEFDMKTGGLVRTIAIPTPPSLRIRNSAVDRMYLVGTPNGLLMVIRRVKSYDKQIVRNGMELSFCYRTTGFEIYKLNRGEWSEVNSLGSFVILLGLNSSVCISAGSFPNHKGNQIYFTDDCGDFVQWKLIGGHDVGVFDLEDGSINQLFPDADYIWPPPVWLLHRVP